MWIQGTLFVIGCIALAYQAVALAAALVFAWESRLRLRKAPGDYAPPISILKPIRGLEDGLEAALRSHVLQDYPDFELLVGVRDIDDPAIPLIRALSEQHSEHHIRLIHTTADAPNGKVAVLAALAAEASHPILLVNDADITVPVDYLRRVAAPLASDQVGIVTCLYRANAKSLAGAWESIGIATDFMPSTLVAKLVGVREFGLGSTLCFRAADLSRIGGFEAIEDFIADDYQLAKRITALGGVCQLSEVVVQTNLGSPGWRSVWSHQIRWARTIRVSRGGGYLGLPITHAGLWALANLACGNWGLALALWLARVAMGGASAWMVLGYWQALVIAPLLPLWDLWACAVWVAGVRGDKIVWRDRRLRLTSDGRLLVEK